MYVQHFNLSTEPFSIAPNPRYLYLSPQHREALAHLIYGIGAGGGFVALTGEVGTGKTTLCRCLLEQLPDDVDIALIFNPRLNARELLASICDELGIPHPEHRASIKLLIDLLNEHLLAAHARGRRTVVLIDEAQNLSHDVLEQIRLLTNLETNEFKLLQIILVGQPELKQLLERPNLRQLAQRITARYHLRPLSFREMTAYVDHRLAVSGGRSRIFGPLALFAIYRLSGGIPRLINLICDRALLGAYALGKTRVSWRIVRKSAREVLSSRSGKGGVVRLAGVCAAGMVLGIAGLSYQGWMPTHYADWIVREASALLTSDRLAGHAAPQTTQPELPGNTTPPGSARPVAMAAETKEFSPLPSAAVPTEPATRQPKPTAVLATADVSPQPTSDTPPTAPTELASPTSTPGFRDFIASPAHTRGAALARLFSLWHLPHPSTTGADECGETRQKGLRCLSFQGTWAQLKVLDLPAVLVFFLPDGARRYATLTRASDDRLELAIGDAGGLSFESADILEFWRGEAILLWKPPDRAAASIHPNYRGEGVKWLRQRLGQKSPLGQTDTFDAKLKGEVMAFQRQHGLQPDGYVGPLTLIHLSQPIRDPAMPRLGPAQD